MEWHLSKYTMFTKPPKHNFMVAVNLMKGTQTILLPDELPKLLDFKTLNEEDKLFKKFEKQGLIVNYDELAMLDAMAKVRSDIRSMALTICPTLNCNFDCPYCFERHHIGKMSEEIQDKVISFADKMLESSKARLLFVTWYGGEPLLEPKIIENLSSKLIKLCEDKKIDYKASIITNGYLLTQKIVDMLANYKVLRYQITIDGIEETHDKTRRLANGDGTFYHIIENLQNLKIQGVISIRHNIYKDNIQEKEILENLIKKIKKQSGNNLYYYPAIVIGNKASPSNEGVNTLSIEEQCEILLSKNMQSSPGMAHYCGAQQMSSFVIDNEGRLYKCWEDVDKPERSFGDIKTWNPYNEFYSCNNVENLIKYLNLAGCLEDKECRECIWLPLCKGGCPSKRLFFKKQCLPYKDKPELYLSKLIEKNLKDWEIRHNINNEEYEQYNKC